MRLSCLLSWKTSAWHHVSSRAVSSIHGSPSTERADTGVVQHGVRRACRPFAGRATARFVCC
eukprot:3123456-Prymnesium_polylepis.3